MKLIDLFIFTFFLLLYACNTKPMPEKEPETEEISIEDLPTEEPEEPEVPEPVLNLDSICLDSALKYALKVAQTTIATKGKLEEYYEVRSADSSRSVNVRIAMGHLFSRWQQHLVLQRRLGLDIRLDIFEWRNGRFKGVLTGEDDFMAYVNDTIFDANGDGAKDFLLIHHPPVGCGVCYVNSVYLNQPAQHTFTPRYDFLNPTFSPTERVIRGVRYNPHADGDFPLYKFRWNGLKIDSVEYIYHDYKVKGQFIKVKYNPKRPPKSDSIRLKTLPREYRNITYVDVFIN